MAGLAVECPVGPIDPIGRPTLGGNVILQLYFKRTSTWPKTKSADGKRELSHAETIDRIRQDLGPAGPGNQDVRSSLESLCSPINQKKTTSTQVVKGSYAPAKVQSWSLGKIVSGKYVMIVDLIVDEQEGLDTVLMADPDQLTAALPSIQKYRTFLNLLKIVPAPCHEWADVARLYIVVEQKQLEYERALEQLEAMEPLYFEWKETFEQSSRELMRAKQELAFVNKADASGVSMEVRQEMSKRKVSLEATLNLVRARYLEAKSKYMPLRKAWLANSKATNAAEFEDEEATATAEFAKSVFSQCFNYEPQDPEMFSDQYGHGFSSFYEDVEQYEIEVEKDPKLRIQAMQIQQQAPVQVQNAPAIRYNAAPMPGMVQMQGGPGPAYYPQGIPNYSQGPMSQGGSYSQPNGMMGPLVGGVY